MRGTPLRYQSLEWLVSIPGGIKDVNAITPQNLSIGQCIRDDVIPKLRAQHNVPTRGNDEVLLSTRREFVGHGAGVEAGGEVKGREHGTGARVIGPQVRVKPTSVEDQTAGRDQRRPEDAWKEPFDPHTSNVYHLIAQVGQPRRH